MYGKNLALVSKFVVFVNKIYDKVNYRVVSTGTIKFDFTDCKIPVPTINCVVANAKILDSYFNVSRGIMILRKKIS